MATGSKRRNCAWEPTCRNKSGANPDLFSNFAGHVVCGDDAAIGRGKPNPDIFLYAAHHGLGLQDTSEGAALLAGVRQPGAEHDGKLLGHESEFLVFEDALPGVQAALAAGMKGTSLSDSRMGSRCKRAYGS